MNLFGGPKVPGVSADEVWKAITGDSKPILLDVRTPGEYAKGKIQGGINLPVDQVEEKIESVASNKEGLVYVYCLSGSRSVAAVEMMVRMGYKNVYSMDNGLLAWRIKGHPTV